MNWMISKMRTKKTRWRIRRLIAWGLFFVCLISNLFASAVLAAKTEQVSLTVRQVISSSALDAAPDQTFTYTLTPQAAASPLPAGSDSSGYSFSITGSDQVQIGPISFGGEGIYPYELSCRIGTAAGYTYDRQVYTIEVYVHSNSDLIMTVKKSDGVKAAEIYFEHTYKPSLKDPKDPNISKNGDPPRDPDIPKNPDTFQAPDIPGDPDTPKDPDISEKQKPIAKQNQRGYSGVNTGDDSNLMLWLTLIVISGGFLLILLPRRKADSKSAESTMPRKIEKGDENK